MNQRIDFKFGKLTTEPNQFFWYGDSEHKGIGVFSFSNLSFRLRNDFNPKFRYIIPFEFFNKEKSFSFYAIWAMGNKESRHERYIGQIWLAVNYYANKLKEPSILIGDFNSNKIWDYKDRVGNHMDVVNKLHELKITSLYHKQNQIEHGKEPEPTFYMYRKKEKPYHIDYCFSSENLFKKGFNFKVGKYENWSDLSDHVPIIVDL